MIHRPLQGVAVLVTRMCKFASGSAYVSATAEAKE